MTILLHSTAVGVFADREKAEGAIGALHRAGFASEQIGIAIHDRTETTGAKSPVELSSREVDVTLGAVTGALGGVVLAAATVWYALDFIPMWLAIGAGAIVGAVGGGMTGAWASMDIPPEEVEFLERDVKAGHAVVTVRADERMQEADAILRRCGAHHVGHSRERPTAAA